MLSVSILPLVTDSNFPFSPSTRPALLLPLELGYHETSWYAGDLSNRPALLRLDEPSHLPIDKHGADLLFQVVAARDESGSIVLNTTEPRVNTRFPSRA